MIRRFDLPDPVEYRLFFPHLKRVFKLLNLRLGNRICPDRHIDSGTLFQDLIQLADAVPQIQDDHIIIAVIDDLLQQPDPFLRRCTLDILHRKHRRQIVQIVDTLHHRSHLCHNLIRSQPQIIQQIPQCLLKFPFHQIFKPGIRFQIQVQTRPFLRQDLPQRQRKCCLHRPSDRRIHPDHLHLFLLQF